jgi:hypothetical protein
MTTNSFRYATKVWLTSVLFSPFVFLLINGTLNTEKLKLKAVGLNGFIFLSLLIGFLISIPNWITFFFLIKFINKQRYSIIIKKTYIILTGFCLTLILFCLTFFRDYFVLQYDFHSKLFISYSVTIIIGIIIYKLKPDKKVDSINDR